ncbi:hypothetical protein T01_8076 [Trichinella spiralis]|uniref:Uncharacterized protein n=1 Tax=Trichinella spiralis TaxID=6334 RepID=A0A0V1APD2_TRISP|nr:hypothetical protein T01_8076 [Trichinella spiralis]
MHSPTVLLTIPRRGIYSSMARLPRFSASSKAVACRGDTSSFDDTTMCPSAAEGSTKLAPNVGVLV